MSKCVAIIQARMGSKRLPGKIFKPIGRRNLLDEVVSRGRAVPSLNEVIVATSTETLDDPVAEHCAANGIPYHRGNESDVLDRIYQTALSIGAKHVMRLTADNPLFDIGCMEELVSIHVNGGYDYTHSVTSWGCKLPYGTGAEIFTMENLETSWREGTEPEHREHVDEFTYQHPERFKIHLVQPPAALQRPELKLTVDNPEDLTLMQEVFRAIEPENRLLELSEAITFLDTRPDLLRHFTYHHE
jgi:spore coat polysaccharide biosynthesis protein SpsF